MNWLELLDENEKIIKNKHPSNEEVTTALDEQINEIKKSIDKEFDSIYVLAKIFANWFWTMKDMSIADKEFSRFGTRVKIISGTLSIEWYENRIVTDKLTGKKKIYSDYIKKGTGVDKYSMRCFKTSLDWEKEVIEIVENKYAILRKRARILTKIKENIRQYELLKPNIQPHK